MRTVNMYGIRLYINDLPSSAHGVIRNNMISPHGDEYRCRWDIHFGGTLRRHPQQLDLHGRRAAIDEVRTLGGNDIVCINILPGERCRRPPHLQERHGDLGTFTDAPISMPGAAMTGLLEQCCAEPERPARAFQPGSA